MSASGPLLYHLRLHPSPTILKIDWLELNPSLSILGSDLLECNHSLTALTFDWLELNPSHSTLKSDSFELILSPPILRSLFHYSQIPLAKAEHLPNILWFQEPFSFILKSDWPRPKPLDWSQVWRELNSTLTILWGW